MSTIYVFNEEIPSLTTRADGDKLLVHDASTGLKKTITLSNVQNTILGNTSADTLGFYGVTKVDQGTMTATCLTAIGTTTISAGNAAGVWAFVTSTSALALVKRVSQCQADLETLMNRVHSTGLLAIAGL